MSTLTRVLLSWTAVVVAIVLAVFDSSQASQFGDPTVIVPLALAYVLRCEIRPAIRQARGPCRLWLIFPVALFAFYMVLPLDMLLVAVITVAVIWGVRDDISIHRHRSRERKVIAEV